MTAQLFVDFKVEKVLNDLKTKCDAQGCIFISFLIWEIDGLGPSSVYVEEALKEIDAYAERGLCVKRSPQESKETLWSSPSELERESDF